MFKKMLSILQLKGKLLVITVITIFNLAIVTILIQHIFGTFTALHILADAERNNNNDLRIGIIEFYQWTYNPHVEDIDQALYAIEIAKKMPDLFAKYDSITATLTNDSLQSLLLYTFDKTLDNNLKNAKLLANRLGFIKYFYAENFSDIVETSKVCSYSISSIQQSIQKIKLNLQSKEEHELLRQLIERNDRDYEAFAHTFHVLNAKVSNALTIMLIVIMVVFAIIIILVSNRVAHFIATPIKEIIGRFSYMAQGIMVEAIPVTSKDETGALVAAFNELQTNLKNVVHSAKQVAVGNFNSTIVPKSEKDELSVALNQMTLSLIENSEKERNFHWHKTGKNQLIEMLRGDLSMAEISSTTLSFFASYLPVEWATIYIFDENENVLKLSGYYGMPLEDLPYHIPPGDMLTGMCFASNKPIFLDTLVPENVKIKCSMLEISAKSLCLFPLVHDESPIGVIELASKDIISENSRLLVQEVTESITIALKSAASRLKLNALLLKLQQQAEELQTQQEELRVTNEELEEQTIALRENEKQLQIQQEELRVTNEELEERTQDLELQKSAIGEKNNELEIAKMHLEEKAKQIELSSKYKSEFLANMSHELRTPLNSLLILSRDLAENKKQNLTDKQVESASIIYQSGQDLLTLINEILDLSKIESGKMTITPELVSLSEISQTAYNNFKHMAEIKGLHFNIEIDDDVPESIVIDKHRLDQILKNLVSNAIKFTHKGFITIRFKNTAGIYFRNEKLRFKNTIMISVQDSGIGIAAEKQQEIFEAFQQADGSISRKYGGTGLGLSITRELTKLLGGEIHLKSEPGTGSTFMLILPLKTPGTEQEYNQSETLKDPDNIIAENNSTENNNAPKSQANQETENDEEYFFIPDDRKNLQPGDKCLLIVEDDPRFAKTLLSQSRERGFKCIVAETGEQAILLTEKYHPDAIILDIILPGMDGYKVLEILKSNANTRHIPVHFMSATDDLHHDPTKGAIGFVRKPVDPNSLDKAFKKIESYVSKTIKDVLVIEDDFNTRSLIKNIIGGADINVSEANTGKKALELIDLYDFDCMVLDLGLPDMAGIDLLKTMREMKKTQLPPVIIYTGRELNKNETTELQKHVSSIIIKGFKSEERLLDETALFLHRVVDNLPENKKKTISQLHDKEAVFKNKNILLVDDDMRNIFALMRILEDRGMNIFEAENGQVAIDLLQQNPNIDLILMDIMMPVMDGYTAIKEIRKHERWRNLPIITLTAKAMKEDREKSIQAGANDYLPKPVDVSKLLSLLRVWLYK